MFPYTSALPSSFDYERDTEVDYSDNGREATYDMMYDPAYDDRYDNADY